MTGLDKSLKRKWRVFDIKGHYTSVPRKTLIKPKVPQNSNGIILFFSKKYFWFLFLFLFLFVFLMGVGRLGDTLVIEKKIFVSSVAPCRMMQSMVSEWFSVPVAHDGRRILRPGFE